MSVTASRAAKCLSMLLCVATATGKRNCKCNSLKNCLQPDSMSSLFQGRSQTESLGGGGWWRGDICPPCVTLATALLFYHKQKFKVLFLLISGNSVRINHQTVFITLSNSVGKFKPLLPSINLISAGVHYYWSQLIPEPHWITICNVAACPALFRLCFFGVPGPGGEGGGGLQKPFPLHKSESIDTIDRKLGGLIEHYYLINYYKTHAIMTS